MSTKEQYKLAYRLLRDPDYFPWDFSTFKIVAMGLGVDQPARIAALRSYIWCKYEDQIGESYLNLVGEYAKIHAESMSKESYNAKR